MPSNTLQPQPIDREQLLARLRDPAPWDAVIIGGGATGLGIAVEAAARGLRVALIERGDFACGTSSRSTKLIHGGVRYLAQGNLKLVREALSERAILRRIAPDIVKPLEFVVPCYRLGERAWLRLGLGVYDRLAGNASLGPTRWLSCQETLKKLPGVRSEGLIGGVSYWDAQFDDAAMAIALMQTAYALGATPINYVQCDGFDVRNGTLCAVHIQDTETQEPLLLKTGCVFNAAGVWVDHIRAMASSESAPIIKVSQGSHVVLSRHWMPSDAALLVPRTQDGRVLFVIPWYDALLVGTTDSVRADAPAEPMPSASELDYLLHTAGAYLDKAPTLEDVRAQWSGLRPLYAPSHTHTRSSGTAKISREHAVLVEHGNLISVVGGKWTTYRRMAHDALETAIAAKTLASTGTDDPTQTLSLVPPVFTAHGAETFRTQLSDPQFQTWARAYTQARTEQDIAFRRTRLKMIEP